MEAIGSSVNGLQQEENERLNLSRNYKQRGNCTNMCHIIMKFYKKNTYLQSHIQETYLSTHLFAVCLMIVSVKFSNI